MRRCARIPGLAAFPALLLASLSARAQQPLAPPPEPPPAATTEPPAPPPTTAPANDAAPPPSAAPPPPSATPPRPAQPYPYPYPYAYPPQPYGYPPQPYGYPPPQPYAYPPAPASPAPGRAPVPAAVIAAEAPPPAPGSQRVHDEDPQADRGVLMPTAYTHPKGTLFVSSYEVFLLQLGVALTDDTQLSLTTIPPLSEERLTFIDLTLKTSLYRGGLVRVAALGSTSGIAAKELGVLGVGRAGAVLQVCLERRCGSSLSMSTNVTLAGIMFMTNGVSGIFRMGRTLSILAELDSLVPLARDAGAYGGAMTGGGLRWHWTHWGLDLSLMHVIGHANATFPIVAVTYRSR